MCITLGKHDLIIAYVSKGSWTYVKYTANSFDLTSTSLTHVGSQMINEVTNAKNHAIQNGPEYDIAVLIF